MTIKNIEILEEEIEVREDDDVFEEENEEDNMIEEEIEMKNNEIETPKIVEEPAAPKKRGRKKGVKVGPRPVVWVCAGIVDEECVLERFSAPEGASFDELESFSSEDAKNAFIEMYDCEPAHIDGPLFEKKGGMSNDSSPKKRDTVDIAMPNLTMERTIATYKGWQGMAYGIEGREDACFFIPGKEINPSDKKRGAMAAKTIFKSAAKFVSESV